MLESTIREIVKFTMENERACSCHHRDFGGNRYWGISERYAKQAGVNIPVTREQAEEILIKDAARCGIFEVDKRTALFLFDAGVLFTFDLIVRWFQWCINIHLRRGGVKVDGIIGPKTLNAYGRCERGHVLELLNNMIISHHVNVAKHYKREAVFLREWLVRAKKRYELAKGSE